MGPQVRTRVLLSVIVAIVVASCNASPAPSAAPQSGVTPPTAPVSRAPSSSAPTSQGSSPTQTIEVSPGATSTTIVPTGRILFSRHNPTTDDVFCYAIDPDGTHETPWVNCGALSPDGTKILGLYAIPNGFGPFLHARPTTTKVDGTGIKLLDAYPHDNVSFYCSSWSPDGKRLLCESGADTIAADDGIYTVRASDGGDLRRLTKAPAKHEDQPFGYSPDGKRILFIRFSDNEPSVVYAMNTDGSGLLRLSPPDLSASDWSFPAAWSPDGSQIAFGATKVAVGLRSLFVVKADGSGLKEISPADAGGISAQWSPDGRWIAFTSRICCQPQVWIVHPDGTSATQLTDGHDGSTSYAQIWSPDGGKLLFVRDDGGGHQSLWTMNPDGTGKSEIAQAGEGFDLGSNSWLPAAP